MADQNVDIVRGAYDSFSRGDVPGVLDMLSDDIEWNVPPPLPQAMEAHGRDDVGRFFERLGSVYDGIDIQVEDLVASGDRVCVIGHGSGKANGRDVDWGFTHCWKLADGKAVRFDEYAQPGQALL